MKKIRDDEEIEEPEEELEEEVEEPEEEVEEPEEELTKSRKIVEREEKVITKDDLLEEEYEQCQNCGSFDLNFVNNIFTCTRCGCRWTYED